MPQTEKHLPSAKRRMIDDRQDVSDFADEYTLLKRLKKGKISEVNSRGVFSCHTVTTTTFHLSWYCKIKEFLCTIVWIIVWKFLEFPMLLVFEQI